MTSLKSFYITTTLPYVNAEPHIGFALEIIQADALARFHSLMGDSVFFNTGTDEHGQKIYDKAIAEGKTPQEYTDFFADKFQQLKTHLNLFSDIHFIRTSDAHHIAAAQEFWKRCDANGDIYKKSYKTKYCVGCELEKTDSELDDKGQCPLHPNKDLEIIEEENYFFRYSKYGAKLLELYEKNPQFVFPDSRFNEIKRFVERGLEDFSISRLKSKMSWGVAVPNDPEHVMYVWFDALVSYISTLGWPEKDLSEGQDSFWPGLQVAGKDQVRMQAGMWQAMLLSAGLPNSKQIFIHGFITSGGQKMSKSLGNVIDPLSIISEYGVDALRYYLLREIHPFEDSDFTIEKFKESYNANLANGLGNLTSRIMKMAETHVASPVTIPENTITQDFKDAFAGFDFNKAMDIVWKHVGELDKIIQQTEPYKMMKVEDDGGIKKAEGLAIITDLIVRLYTIGRMLNPMMPETSVKIKEAVKANKKPEMSLFERK